MTVGNRLVSKKMLVLFIYIKYVQYENLSLKMTPYKSHFKLLVTNFAIFGKNQLTEKRLSSIKICAKIVKNHNYVHFNAKLYLFWNLKENRKILIFSRIKKNHHFLEIVKKT